MNALRWCLAAAVLTPLALAPAAARAQVEERVGAAAYFGEGFAVVATVREPDKRVEELKKFIEAAKLLERSWAKEALGTPQAMQGKVALAGLAATAGTDPWTAVGAALGEELMVGLRPGEDPTKPRLLAVGISRDKKTVDKLLMSVETLAGLIKAGKPDPDKTVTVRGETVFKVNEELAFCRARDAVIVASTVGMIEEALAARAGEGKAGLVTNVTYAKAARRAAEGGESVAAWIWADTQNIRALKQLPTVIENPLGGFLFGGWLHDLHAATSGAAFVSIDGNDLGVRVMLEGAGALPKTHAGFETRTILGTPTGAWSLKGQEVLGEWFIVRGWAKLFSEREALLTLPGAGQVVQFSNQLTAFLGQLDFMGDVLPAVQSPLRFIATRQDFTDMPYLPTPRLPAFALVAPLKPGAVTTKGMGGMKAGGVVTDLEKRLYSGSQTALSLINLDAANKGEASMLIDSDRYKEQRIVFTEFPTPPTTVKGGQPAIENGKRVQAVVGQRQNFAPAIAIVKNQYIAATSTELLKAIIDAMLDPKAVDFGPDGTRPVADLLTVSGDGLARLLDDNREEYIADQMLKKAISRAQAENEMEALRGFLGLVQGVRVVNERGEGGYAATVTVSLYPPEPEVSVIK